MTEIDQHIKTKNVYSRCKGIENETFKRVSEMIEDSVSKNHKMA